MADTVNINKLRIKTALENLKAASEAGHPFQVCGPYGMYAGKTDLLPDPVLQKYFGKKQCEDLAYYLLGIGELQEYHIPGSKSDEDKWLDIPGGALEKRGATEWYQFQRENAARSSDDGQPRIERAVTSYEAD